MNLDSLVLYNKIKQCVTLSGVAAKKGRLITEQDLGVIENAAVVADASLSQIVWVGKSSELPQQFSTIVNEYNCEGEVWLPELVECHTHLVFAGDRSHDFAMRAGGKTYAQIAAEGGGILTTLKHTREASFEDLVENAESEINRFQALGVGTIEIKSGYGLSLESELKILKCIQALQQRVTVQLVPTFLPAHAIPPEYKGRGEDYVRLICEEWIPEVAKAKLASYFDVFVEDGYFSVSQAEKLCLKASEYGMGIKIHADQFKSLGGTQLAVKLNAQSVDHLDNISVEDIKALSNSNTVAVLCPGASLFTGTPYAPARALIDSGARVALTTDFNPGTCPSRNLPLMTTIACTQMKMTVAEAIAGITYNAAAALGLETQIGSIEPGKQFRICQIKADSYKALPYCFGELQ
ncbi:MAG: imidazolonepropionase [Deltaproteobacteria bacterium]|nr:imidazolonepropionase [Deltaproteobacteria bacterium]